MDNSENMDRIKRIAKKNKLIVIEDCAEALGSKYRNKMVGNLSDCSTLVSMETK